MNDEYALLRKNIATYIRKKDPERFDEGLMQVSERRM